MSNHKEPPPDFVRDIIDPGWREREEKTRAFWSSIPLKRPREHTTSADCWCGPTVDYVDPETGVAVYVHHDPN